MKSWFAAALAKLSTHGGRMRRAVGWGKPLRFEAPLKRITKLAVSSREFHVLLTILNCFRSSAQHLMRVFAEKQRVVFN